MCVFTYLSKLLSQMTSIQSQGGPLFGLNGSFVHEYGTRSVWVLHKLNCDMYEA